MLLTCSRCFLVVASEKEELDGWRMMQRDDTGTDISTVNGAWEKLVGGGAAVFFRCLFDGILIGGIVALVYFFIDKTLTLGFIENSGILSAIQFKHSVIENQEINEVPAMFVS